MSFFGTSFVFDGVPSEEFSLMLYDFTSNGQDAGSIGTKIEVSEDRIWGRATSIYYGASEKDALEFKLVCGVPDGNMRLDRLDLARIAGWLKHTDYRTLKIVQPDMEQFHYKCIITELTPIMVGLEPVGLEANVLCDGPFAYMDGTPVTFTCDGTADVVFYNRSNLNRYLYQPVELTVPAGGDVTITNHSDKDEMVAFRGLPSQSITIKVDGHSGIVDAGAANGYEFFNFTYPRFVRGENHLTLTGKFTMSVNTEFPMDIGC